MHINGGSKFSELCYEIFCDGKPTGITRRCRTSGSPRYLKTIETLTASNGDEFDILGSRGTGMMEWLEQHKPAEG